MSPPDLARSEQLRATVAEFVAAGEFIHGSALWEGTEAVDRLASDAGVASYVAELRRFAEPGADLGDKVPCEFSWIVDGDDVMVGFLALRTRLNDFLLEEGGHIGYSVRPSARRLGHASRALALAVARAGELGLGRVLVTCELANAASAAVIESAGGVEEDVRGGKRRYWVDVTRDGSAATPA